ncbi:hypothetical protein C4K23_1467 [Pseudomonas chlororaphis]|nr:hypothetical protein C4K23_1467 [Pseudomonas chlororaphis]
MTGKVHLPVFFCLSSRHASSNNGASVTAIQYPALWRRALAYA